MFFDTSCALLLKNLCLSVSLLQCMVLTLLSWTPRGVYVIANIPHRLCQGAFGQPKLRICTGQYRPQLFMMGSCSLHFLLCRKHRFLAVGIGPAGRCCLYKLMFLNLSWHNFLSGGLLCRKHRSFSSGRLPDVGSAGGCCLFWWRSEPCACAGPCYRLSLPLEHSLDLHVGRLVT